MSYGKSLKMNDERSNACVIACENKNENWSTCACDWHICVSACENENDENDDNDENETETETETETENKYESDGWLCQ